MKDFTEDKDYELWMLLAQAREAMYKARQKELRRYNLSPRQSAVLFIIRAIGDKVTPAEISRRLLRESHSVSEIISRMEKQGLLKKVRDLDRKNLVRIELTEKGSEAYSQAIKRDSIHKIMSALSDEERRQFSTMLITIRDRALKESGKELRTPFPPL
ncbi:MAG: winged helix DNA-binding protein [Chloroflexi bacterium]|nr:winged helix DNA-binding protein [Chloroflexota bacterium]